MNAQNDQHINWRDYVDLILGQIERRFEERDEAVRAALEAHKESTELAFAATEKQTSQSSVQIQQRFEAQEKAVAAALAASDRAVSKAEAATERRLEGMNEFRDALNDYSRTLMPRPEFEASHRETKEKLEAMAARITDRNMMPRTESEKMHTELKERLEQLTTRMSARDLMPRAESEKMHADTKEKLEALTVRVNARDAKGAGRHELWAYGVGAVGIVVAVVTIMNKLFGE